MRTSIVLKSNQLLVITFGKNDEILFQSCYQLDMDGGDNDVVITAFHSRVDDVRIGFGIADAILPDERCETLILD